MTVLQQNASILLSYSILYCYLACLYVEARQPKSVIENSEDYGQTIEHIWRE